ncbi:hypothetical protein C8J57DRAFT_691087 [Mycena rebaudengoi]|nr:hypothetical protein C8J57DRAFT_691087 [Mycena rebaudengoi]
MDAQPTSGRNARKRRRFNTRVEQRPKGFGWKGGRLEQLLQVPLDILFEVLSHLLPLDILLLARLSNKLRSVLMHRSALHAWKTARANVLGLPDPPAEMSEPAWADLVFDRHCSVCLAKGIWVIQWRLRMRLCKPCNDTIWVLSNS